MKQAIQFNAQREFTLLYPFGQPVEIFAGRRVFYPKTTFPPDRRVLCLNFRLRRHIRNPAYEIQNLQ